MSQQAPMSELLDKQLNGRGEPGMLYTELGLRFWF